MPVPLVDGERKVFHLGLMSSVWNCLRDIPSNADNNNATSIAIARVLARQFRLRSTHNRLAGSAVGAEFERQVLFFIERTVPKLRHLRSGRLQIARGLAISAFEQYLHLEEVRVARELNAALAAAFVGDYTIRPDIVIARLPEPDSKFNESNFVVGNTSATLTPLRESNNTAPILQASISCKWTIRSDRSQNARAEGVNLLRSRKGRAPAFVVVTAEPLPSRIASIALGTGEIDCTYHVCLPELQEAIEELNLGDAREMLRIMVEGRRLRDISDLPFDLVT